MGLYSEFSGFHLGSKTHKLFPCRQPCLVVCIKNISPALIWVTPCLFHLSWRFWASSQRLFGRGESNSGGTWAPHTESDHIMCISAKGLGYTSPPGAVIKNQVEHLQWLIERSVSAGRAHSLPGSRYTCIWEGVVLAGFVHANLSGRICGHDWRRVVPIESHKGLHQC